VAEAAAGGIAGPNTDVSELVFGATPGYIATARLFAATIGRHYGLTNETLEDLRLAVSEACTLAVEAGGGSAGRPVKLSLRWSGEALQVEVQDVGEPHPARSVARRQLDHEVRLLVGSLELVGMLFEDAEVLPGKDGAHLLRFSTGSVAAEE
jgi:serine/threonine-protein kinase RsbW